MLAMSFVLGVLATPWLESRGVAAASTLRSLYASLCHQNPARCLELAGSAWSVCSRCSGLYLGGLTGLLLCAGAGVGLMRRPSRLLLAVAVAPTLVDALLPWIGLPQLSTVPRLFLAFPAGLMAGLFLGHAVAELARSRFPVRAPSAGGLR